MHAHPLGKPTFFGKLNAIAITTLGVCYLFDTTAQVAGWHTATFCIGIDVLLLVAMPLGALLCLTGALLWLTTRRRLWLAMEIAGMGVLLLLIPDLLPPFSALPCGY